MTQKLKFIIGITIFGLVLACAVFAYNALQERVAPEMRLTQQSGSVDTAGQEETQAPDFTAMNADGESVKLSDLFGKPIVLNFWASWCPPCKDEMPDFDKVYAEFGEEVTFMMLNMTDGQRETAAIAAKYVADQGFSFPIYFDTTQEAAYTYGVRSIPTTIFIDKDGSIVTGAEGRLDEKTLRNGIGLIHDIE